MFDIANDRLLETKGMRRSHGARELAHRLQPTLRYYIIFKKWTRRLFVHTQYPFCIYESVLHLFCLNLSAINNKMN